jgi:hypothetical protein
MKNITDFKNIHKNSDIYIIASGKTLDFINNDFFDNKITIGVNQVYKKIECKYLVRKEYVLLDEVINNNPNSIHFISKSECGSIGSKNYDYVKNKGFTNVVVFDHNINSLRIPDQFPVDDKIVVSHSTITSAIHLAAYMGAKNILIVGHDCGKLNGESNFKNYHTTKTYSISWKNGKKDYDEWLKIIEQDTIKLKKILTKKYNCNIYSINPFINYNLEGNKYEK